MLHPRNNSTALCHPGLHPAMPSAAIASIREGGAIEIGKINLILIGLIVIILFALISKEESGSGFSNHTARIQTQLEPAETPAEHVEAPATGITVAESPAPAVEPPAPAKVTPKENSKKTKKVEVAAPVSDSGPVVQVHTSQAAPVTPPQPVVESAAPKDPSTKMLVFNIWSVSELRLRSAYTTWMNDSAVPATQLEARKKEYLSFVSQRAHKCGELDSRFAGNINTVEKLNFNKGDVDVLECHAAENNTELDKLSARNS